MGLLDSVTDSIGLTDFAGQRSAMSSARGALGDISGESRKLVDWWNTNAAPYQLGLMERGMGLYNDATYSNADYSKALGNVESDVGRSFSRANQANELGLRRYGVDPNSGRFASTMTTSANNQGATEAALKNATRKSMKDSEFGRKAQALGLASGLNSPNYGLVGTGIGGLSTAAGGYGNIANNLTSSNMGAIGGLLQGAGYAYGLADGGEYADGGEKFMGDAMRVDEMEGEIEGPGSPISDSIEVEADEGKARLADGEYVIPTDVVSGLGLRLIKSNPEKAAHMVGVKLLDDIKDGMHVPAEVQGKLGLSADPNGYCNGGKKMADGGEKERPSLGSGLAESAAKSIEERKKRLKEALGYADGGESGWEKGLAMLGHGLANAYSRGGWLGGVESGKRDAEIEKKNKIQDEAMARKQKYLEALSRAGQTPYTGGDVNDPEFGIQAQGMEQNATQYDPQQYKQDVEAAMRKYAPEQYAGLMMAPKKLTNIAKGAAAIDSAGNLVYQNPDTGDGAGSDSRVQLVNGQIVKESDLRSEYNTRYGKYDPVMQQYVMDNNAPTYDEYRNNQVTERFRRSYESPQKEDVLPEAPTKAELERAAAELNTETGNSGDYIPFNEYGASDQEVLARAYKNRGMTQQGVQKPTGKRPQKSEIPPDKVKLLSPGKITTFKNGQQWTIQNGKPVRIK